MEAFVKTPSVWLSAWTRRNIHPAAIAGIALLIATATFDSLMLEPGEAKLQSLQEALARRTQPVRADTVSVSDIQRPDDKLRTFYAFFRRDLKLSDWLARVYDIADRAGVRPQHADYRLLDSAETLLLRYEVSLPLSGDYGKIRSFAEGVLNAVPVASLDHIAFRRQRAAQGAVEAELRFTLYMARPQ